MSTACPFEPGRGDFSDALTDIERVRRLEPEHEDVDLAVARVKLMEKQVRGVAVAQRFGAKESIRPKVAWKKKTKKRLKKMSFSVKNVLLCHAEAPGSLSVYSTRSMIFFGVVCASAVPWRKALAKERAMAKKAFQSRE